MSNLEQGLGESTVRLFKKRYLEELKRAKNSVPVGEVPVVKEISVKTRGRPLLVREFDSNVQMYIKALRNAGTPVSVPVVLAAAEGVITARNRSALLKYGGHIELGRPWAVSSYDGWALYNDKDPHRQKLNPLISKSPK